MMDLDIPERLIPVRDKIDSFVREKIDPLTEDLSLIHISEPTRRS